MINSIYALLSLLKQIACSVVVLSIVQLSLWHAIVSKQWHYNANSENLLVERILIYIF